jgi:hypothetical protein
MTSKNTQTISIYPQTDRNSNSDATPQGKTLKDETYSNLWQNQLDQVLLQDNFTD